MTFIDLIIFTIILVSIGIVAILCLHKVLEAYERMVNEINHQHEELEVLEKLVDKIKLKDDGLEGGD
jgi:exonuclease VII small subunit